MLGSQFDSLNHVRRHAKKRGVAAVKGAAEGPGGELGCELRLSFPGHSLVLLGEEVAHLHPIGPGRVRRHIVVAARRLRPQRRDGLLGQIGGNIGVEDLLGLDGVKEVALLTSPIPMSSVN